MLLQEFERRVTGPDGEPYVVLAYGRSRPGDTWEGWLVFVRERDNRQFPSPVETTQPNADAVRYWASGLEAAYLDGALRRALESPQLTLVEQGVMAIFQRLRVTRTLTQRMFDELPFAHAEVLRALEDLEQWRRFLIRETEEGNDWLTLTSEGAVAARLPVSGTATSDASVASNRS